MTVVIEICYMSKQRSMEFLRPKLRILYFIWKKNGFQYNTSALSKALKYADDEPVRRMVNALLEDGYLEVKAIKGKEMLKITRNGTKKINLLIFPLFFFASILSLSADLIMLGANEMFFGIKVSPVNYVLIGIVSLTLTLSVWYLQNLSEKRLLQIGGEPPSK